MPLLDLHEARHIGVEAVDVAEAGGYAALEVDDAREEGLERLTLVHHHLTAHACMHVCVGVWVYGCEYVSMCV